MQEENNGYSFQFVSSSPKGEEVTLTVENAKMVDTKLQLYLDMFERFLQSCDFYLDRKHLELVDE